MSFDQAMAYIPNEVEVVFVGQLLFQQEAERMLNVYKVVEVGYGQIDKDDNTSKQTGKIYT